MKIRTRAEEMGTQDADALHTRVHAGVGLADAAHKFVRGSLVGPHSGDLCWGEHRALELAIKILVK